MQTELKSEFLQIKVGDLIDAFAAQVDAMFASDRPVGTIVLPFQPEVGPAITLLGGNSKAFGGYIHQRIVRALTEDEDGEPNAIKEKGHQIGYLAKLVMNRAGYNPERLLSLRPIALSVRIFAQEVSRAPADFPLPMYRSGTVIRPKGFTFSHSR